MRSWAWAAVLVAVAAALASRERAVLPRFVAPQPALFRDVPCRDASELHHDEATAALRSFAEAYQSSFDFERGGTRVLRDMFASKSKALRHLGELRMRLPNDLTQELELAEFTDRATRTMVEHIDDARVRTKAGGAHPSPIDDAYYAAVARAADSTFS